MVCERSTSHEFIQTGHPTDPKAAEQISEVIPAFDALLNSQRSIETATCILFVKVF